MTSTSSSSYTATLLADSASARYVALVDAAAALADIRGYAAAGRILFASHARERMLRRGIQSRDVRHALSTASTCRLQENDRWRVESYDLSGDELTLVVVIEDGVVVVTLF